jgi:hypothetical protein
LTSISLFDRFVPGPNLNGDLIGEELDLETDGMNVNLASTKQQADTILKMCRLPPLGDREVFPGSRLANYSSI